MAGNSTTIKVGADTTAVVAEFKKLQTVGEAMSKKVGEIPRQLVLAAVGAEALKAALRGVTEAADRASKSAASIGEKKGEAAIREGVIRGQLGLTAEAPAAAALFAEAKRPGALGEDGGMQLAASIADSVSKMGAREKPTADAITAAIRLAQEGLFTAAEVQSRLADTRQGGRFTDAEIAARRAAQSPEVKRELRVREEEAKLKKETAEKTTSDLRPEVERRAQALMEQQDANQGIASTVLHSIPFIGDAVKKGDLEIARATAQRQIIEEQYQTAKSGGIEFTGEQQSRIARAAGKTDDFSGERFGIRSTDEQSRLFTHALMEITAILKQGQDRQQGPAAAQQRTATAQEIGTSTADALRKSAPKPPPALGSRDIP